MTWVTWRLQRTEMIVALGILALLAAFLVPTGIEMVNAYHRDGLASCFSISASGNPTPTCASEMGAFRQRFQSLLDLGIWFTLVPGLIGTLLAAPFILDLERGTHRLAWTQSITRGRWILGKVGIAVVGAAVAGGALSLLLSWWRSPSAGIDGRLLTSNYDTTGVVAVGYTIFGLALALALGALWRRTAVSLTVAFVGYFAVRLLVDYSIRDHLVAPLTATYKGYQQPGFLNNAHVISMYATLHGRQIMRDGGFVVGGAKVVGPHLNDALFHVVYQPDSHYWPLQLAETGLFVGVAAVLIFFAAWWTHRRTS